MLFERSIAVVINLFRPRTSLLAAKYFTHSGFSDLHKLSESCHDWRHSETLGTNICSVALLS